MVKLTMMRVHNLPAMMVKLTEMSMTMSELRA